MQLTLVGNEAIVLNETDILSLPTYTGSGGFITSVGSIRGSDNYTGVLITDLLALVGGITSNDSIEVTASDGYTMVLLMNKLWVM